MAEKKAKTHTVTMVQDRETKNKIRYRDPADDSPIQTIYLDKELVEKIGAKKEIEVTVASA